MHGSTSGRVAHLVDRHPSVSPERPIAQLRPPPTFSDVSFATYSPGVGLYLDGGFGVGKTHLLASAYYLLPGEAPERPTPKAFVTFGELTQLGGVFGLVECIDMRPVAVERSTCGPLHGWWR